jgi:glycosyltransferase involved in cell wall biosynthesis
MRKPAGHMGLTYPTLRILIPAHNESRRIEPTIRDFCAHFAQTAHVTVVANGCTDATVAIVESLQREYANLDLLDIPGRIGKGGAVRAGFKVAQEEYVGFVDADHATSAAEFDRLFRICIDQRRDGVIGSRWLPGSRVFPRQPIARRIASRTFNRLVKLLLGLQYADTQCGAKIFRRTCIDSVFDQLELADFTFDIDLLLALHNGKFSVAEEPTEWSDRAAGTKIQLLPTAYKMLAATLRLRLRQSIVAKLPFFDFLARSSVIPVARRLSILLLSDRYDARGDGAVDVFLQNCANDLAAHGDSVHVVSFRPSGAANRAGLERHWLRTRRVVHRLRILSWYTFFSNRNFDAIIEVASSTPFVLPMFSIKQTAVIFDAPPIGALAEWWYARFYRRAMKVALVETAASGDTTGERPGTLSIGSDAAGRARFLNLLRFTRVYKAQFEFGAGDDWALHTIDERSSQATHTLPNSR